MIYLIIGGVAIGALVSYVLRRAFGSAKVTGAPTSDEARIQEQTKLDARAIVQESDKQKLEVANADNVGLLARLRNSMRK